MAKSFNLVGRIYGRLTVTSLSRQTIPDKTHRRRYWNCECQCGTVCEVGQDALSYGGTRSCGCLAEEMKGASTRTHGATGTPTYKIWLGIKKRCYQQSADNFHKYGGRGIKMCDRWQHDYSAFLADMGERPGDLTIERNDCNGDYEPGNCRWITLAEQASNRRNTVRGLDGKSLAQTAASFGVNYKYLHKLYRTKGMPLLDAIAKAQQQKASQIS